jgi:hypothetical protein
MQEYEDTELEPITVDGVVVPVLRLNDIDLPAVELRVGGTEYLYDRSVPIKGHGAILPRYLADVITNGKKPLLVERIERYYVYLAREKAATPPPAAEPAVEEAPASAGPVNTAEPAPQPEAEEATEAATSQP